MFQNKKFNQKSFLLKKKTIKNLLEDLTELINQSLKRNQEGVD
jgi:hypothetical protein